MSTIHIRHEPMRIGGEKIKTKNLIEITNPFTEKVIGTVPSAEISHVEDAFNIAAS